MTKWVVDLKTFDGYAKTYLNDKGIAPYSGKSEAEYIKEGFSILTDEEYLKLIEEWEDGLCGKWQEITAENYEEMFEILPPVAWFNGGFFMMEKYTGNISSFYQKLNGKYYTSLQRMSRPRKDIIEDLRKFIEESEKH